MAKKKDSKEELQRYLDFSDKLGRRLTKREMEENKFDYIILNRCSKEEGYNSFRDFQIKNNIEVKNLKNEITLKNVINSYKRFYNENNRLPIVDDISKNDYLYIREIVKTVLKRNNMKLLDLCKLVTNNNVDMNYQMMIGLDCNDDIYNEYKSKFIKECMKNNNNPISQYGICNKYNLPNVNWFIKNCPNKNVKTYKDFCEWCGFIRPENITKEEAKNIILKMQSKLDRPLMYDDFRNPNKDEIGITTVKKFWGTMNKMKRELGLIVNQEDMVHKHIDDINIYINDLHNICDKTLEKYNRNNITMFDIEEFTELNIKGHAIFENIKKIGSNITARKIIESYKDFKLQKEGFGSIHRFIDGEISKSNYEFTFSNKLKELGYIYNKDYFRDVRYREFIKNYDGLLDCDYIIKINNRDIYIEIAGMLRDNEDNYYNNIPIMENSKRRENYRLKLKKKEQMLKENNLEYYIILPSDMKNIDKLFDYIGIINK